MTNPIEATPADVAGQLVGETITDLGPGTVSPDGALVAPSPTAAVLAAMAAIIPPAVTTTGSTYTGTAS